MNKSTYRPGKTRRSTSVRRSRKNTGSNTNNSKRSFSASKNSRRFNNKSGAKNSSQKRRGKRSSFDVSQYINRNPVIQKEEAPYVAQHKFTDFNLSESLVRQVGNVGYVTPTPIQDQIIPYIVAGRDVVGLANTGTGKTAAFLIPLINKVLSNKKESVMILAPTRELVIQIERELRTLTRDLRVFSVTCVGGVGINPQIRALKQHNHFIVGTPGRVKDLIKRGCIKPFQIGTAVLDEADQMLDMGFIGDMRAILRLMKKDRHTLFFSATMPQTIKDLIREFLNDPVNVSVKKQDITSNIAQDVVKVGDRDKVAVLADLVSQKDFSKVIVFGQTKHGVEKLSKKLIQRGVRAISIHGNKSHVQRQQALRRFKDAHVDVLIATDVAARGIHVSNVSHVINYDLPATQEAYVHRIGRTGRVNNKGMALTFVK
jgi:superfamily II DNA/RNA helicase